MRVISKKLLIYGSMFTVRLDEVSPNDDMVRAVRERLMDYEEEFIDFGVIVNSKNQLSLIFLFDYEDDNVGGDNSAFSDFIRFLTGDGLPDFKLKYPIWKKQDGVEYITVERLCELYLKNNRFYGGDEIEAIDIDASPTMLKIDITFKDDDI
jgi:hypothetical protein